MSERDTEDPGIGRAVLIVDAMLANPGMWPHLDELNDQFRRSCPGLYDQLGAACRDGMRLAEALHGQGARAAPSEVPDWVWLGVLTSITTWLAGRARTCVHSPHPNRPEPLMAAAWKPDLIVCTRCPHLLQLPKDSVASLTCDGCGHVVDRAAGEHMWSSGVQLGILTWTFGVCDDCRGWFRDR